LRPLLRLLSISQALEALDTAPDSPLGASVRQRLKTLRLAAGLTQEELASKTGVSPTTVERYEKGRQPSEPFLAKLAEALGPSPAMGAELNLKGRRQKAD
jgi:transcriptional regulator with XRE-family HTH domain